MILIFPLNIPSIVILVVLDLIVDMESFWTDDYAGQIPNSGHELAILYYE